MTSISKKENIINEKIKKTEPKFDCEYLDWWSKYYASIKNEENELVQNEFQVNDSDAKQTEVDSKKQRRLSISILKNFTNKAKKPKLVKEEDMVEIFKLFSFFKY